MKINSNKLLSKIKYKSQAYSFAVGSEKFMKNTCKNS